MAAVSIDVPNNGAGKPTTSTGVTAGSSGRLVEFSINLPLSPAHPVEGSRPAVPQSPEHSGR